MSSKSAILIISHERSLNKAESLIQLFKDSCHLVLLTNIDPAPYKFFCESFNSIIISENFDINLVKEKFENIEYIFSISENLLPLQAKLSQHYGINNITRDSAKILANKQSFNNYCRNIGLESFIPRSITPFTENDILSFDSSFITKPDIGTGANQFLCHIDKRLSGIDYKVWKNGLDFITYLKTNRIKDVFLEANKFGVSLPRFNNTPCRTMMQEYHPSKTPSICPTGVIKGGQLQIAFYLKNSKVFQNSCDYSSLNPEKIHSYGTPTGLFGDFAVWSVPENTIDKEILQQITFFLTQLITNLSIKDLFFSGPDFHITDNGLIAIDFNPRPGNFFNLIDSYNNFQIAKCLWNSKKSSAKHLLWSTLPVVPGKVGNLKTNTNIYSSMPLEMNSLEENHMIPEFQYLQSKPSSLQVCLGGMTEKDLFSQFENLARSSASGDD